MGVDNVHSPDARTFQPPGALEKRLPALVAATDVDLDDDGWAASRQPTAEVLDLEAALRGFSAIGLLLVHDEGKILQVNLDADPVDTTEIVAGLDDDDPVQFLEFDGQVFWTTTSYAGRITDAGVPHNWGMQVPPTPTLGSTTGALAAGRYQVACTYTDASGIESGAPQAAAVTVDGTKAITVTLTPNDDNATHVRVYVTGPDSDAFYWNKTVAVGALPTTITAYGVSTFPLEVQHMRGPIQGSGLFTMQRSIWTHRGKWAFPSHDLSPHLFDPTHEAVYVSAPIRAAAGLPGGVWLATERGLFFLRGDRLENMTVTRKDHEYYARGTKVLPGTKIPAAQSGDEVALFVNRRGLVICTADGRALPVTQENYTVGDVTEKRASIAYVERDDLRQILIALTDTTPEADEYVDPSGSYSLVAEDEWTPILQRILDLEANAPPQGAAVGDIQVWNGTVWTAVPPGD